MIYWSLPLNKNSKNNNPNINRLSAVIVLDHNNNSTIIKIPNIYCSFRLSVPAGETWGQLLIFSSLRVSLLLATRTLREGSSTGVSSIFREDSDLELTKTTVSAEMKWDCLNRVREREAWSHLFTLVKKTSSNLTGRQSYVSTLFFHFTLASPPSAGGRLFYTLTLVWICACHCARACKEQDTNKTETCWKHQ